MLGHLAGREVERKALGSEVLNLYREINLIYSFSEKLAALLDVERVAQLTLQEARRLIVATDGVIMLLDDESGALTTVAGFGDEMPVLGGFHRGRGIVGAIADSGVAEIVNDVDADPRRVTEHTTIKALIGAAMRVGERVTGVIALGSTVPMAYTAGELKLLNTLALQTATAMENARLFERTVQAAAERERLLALNKETEVARAKLESELDLRRRASRRTLFPAELPVLPGFDLAARNRPARQCGGDYYDAIVGAGRDRRSDAAVRRRRLGQGAAGGAGDEQHAGDAARPARPHAVAAGARRAVERRCSSRRRRRRSTSPPPWSTWIRPAAPSASSAPATSTR